MISLEVKYALTHLVTGGGTGCGEDLGDGKEQLPLLLPTPSFMASADEE
jgi:hypothetical protein